MLCCWEERWERKKFYKGGDAKFAAKLSNKYCGLKWFDPDTRRMLKTHDTHCVHLRKLDKNSHRKAERGGGWAYFILGVSDEYDHELDPEENDVNTYDLFEVSEDDPSDFFRSLQSYYEENPEFGLLLKSKGECESELDEDAAEADEEDDDSAALGDSTGGETGRR